jgi:signal transduction histidine kinase/predicted RNA-binding protein with RPS1 domain/ActR/RegA family two-component response regulator
MREEMPPVRRDIQAQPTKASRPLDLEEIWNSFVDDYAEGDTVIGYVRRIKSFGAFVEFGHRQQGLVHRSEILPGKTVQVDDLLWTGDQVKAVIKRIDHSKKQVQLSIAHYLRSRPTLLSGCNTPRHSTPDADGAGDVPLDSQGPANQLAQYESEAQSMFEAPELQPNRIRRILLVEDQTDLQVSIFTVLEEAGFDVTVLDDALDAERAVKEDSYDLVFLDAHTPKADGIDAAAAILEQYPDTRIVIMSGVPWNGHEKTRLATLSLQGILLKPFRIQDIEELFSRLENGIEAKNFQNPMVYEPILAFDTPLIQSYSRKDLCQAAKEILGELVIETGATAAAIFGMDLVTRQAELLTSIGINKAAFEQQRHELDISPVKDVIIDGEFIFEKNAPKWARRKFRYLLPLVDFCACVGVPLTTSGSHRYGLFLFDHQPDQLPDKSRKPVRRTALALNAVIGRYAVERALHAAQEFSVLGQVSAGLAHEVNNRISALAAQIQLMERYSKSLDRTSRVSKKPDPDVLTRLRQQVRAMNDTIDRLRHTANLFQQLISPREGRFCHLSATIQRAVDMLDTTARKSKVAVEIAPLPELPLIRANDVALEQVLINLILNAIQQINEQGRKDGQVLVAVCVDETNVERPVEIQVTDNGPGIHRLWWDRVFDLGFSTRPNGSGLGLFMACTLVESFGGTLEIRESAILAGTTFVVGLRAAYERERVNA